MAARQGTRTSTTKLARVAGTSADLMRVLPQFLCWLLVAFQATAAHTDDASKIVSLIDPAKLATLGERGANPRVQKAVYWLATARKAGEQPSNVLARAVAI